MLGARRAGPRGSNFLCAGNDGHHTFAAIKNDALVPPTSVPAFGASVINNKLSVARRNGEALAEVLGLLPGDGLIWG